MVAHPADYAMVVDPGHEFTDVLCQLNGPGANHSRRLFRLDNGVWKTFEHPAELRVHYRADKLEALRTECSSQSLARCG
jgi:hypothetical protein